ncbi:hypothetical protein ACN27J_28070 [Solwaraspora sp. WMMB762]|uniref:hypothetical protein n=1 Tax=Solwaraspora sp. WMMB762 TaxID=3404120 RepID=UPI003B924F62
MRRTLITAAAATALAFTLAGCGGGDSGVDTVAGQTSPPAATASADAESAGSAADGAAAATKEACDMAVPVSEENTANIEDDFGMLIAAAVEGGSAAETAESEFRSKLAGWSGMLQSLAVDPVDPDVQQALTEAADVVAQINDPDDNTPMGQVADLLAEATGKLKTACA